MNINQLPKVELHLHLDGSVRPATAAELLNKDLDEVKKEMIAPSKCLDLNEYLTRFSIPEQILQTKSALKRVAKELGEDLVSENVIYAEIRFAPMKHLQKGLTKEAVVDSILEGLSEVDLKFNLILCMMRGSSYEENKEVITLAQEYLNKGVCAIDLAGAEAIFPTSDYEDLFALATKNNIPFTIHAGEAAGKESISSAISFGTKRIGHGVRITEDQNLINTVKKQNILLEICPTSNIQTSIFKDYKDHPAKDFYDNFIPISINTDNRTVSNTTLTKEYEYLIKELGFTIEDLININKTSILHSFLTESEKKSLLNEYAKIINNQ